MPRTPSVKQTTSQRKPARKTAPRAKRPPDSKADSSDSGGDATLAYERVRDLLIQDVVSGYFPPGFRLAISALTQRYGTSPTPVRAAVNELLGRGLLTATPRQGARVRAIDENYIVDVYELHSAVVGILIPRCVRYISNADIEVLEELLQAFEAAVRSTTLRSILEANRRFHRFMYGISRNQEAINVMEHTSLLLDALRTTFGFGQARLRNMNSSHRKLLDALAARDAEAALSIFHAAHDEALRDVLAMVKRAK